MTGAAARSLLWALVLTLGGCARGTREAPRADEATGLSEPRDPDTRLCRSNSDCSADEACCLAGNLGSCLPLAAECALPDLQLPLNALNSRLFVDELFVAPGFSNTIEYWYSAQPGAANSCVLEKQCLPGLGLHKLLRFSTQVVNFGAADLMLGGPGAPGVELAACDDSPYLENLLHYELFDAAGSRVADTHGRAAPDCLRREPEGDSAATFSGWARSVA